MIALVSMASSDESSDSDSVPAGFENFTEFIKRGYKLITLNSRLIPQSRKSYSQRLATNARQKT